MAPPRVIKYHLTNRLFLFAFAKSYRIHQRIRIHSHGYGMSMAAPSRRLLFVCHTWSQGLRMQISPALFPIPPIPVYPVTNANVALVRLISNRPPFGQRDDH